MPKIVGGIPMAWPIILGAGVCKDPGHLRPYLHSDLPLGAVVAGSVTPEFREGNQGTVQWPNDWTEFIRHQIGLNSHGMPGPGASEFFERFAAVPLGDRPALASLAGFSADQYAQLVAQANLQPYLAGIEINEGCGNTGKIPDAYSYNNAQATLRAIEQLARTGPIKPVWVKLSPYITANERDELATRYPQIDFSAVPTVEAGFAEAMVTLILTFPFVKAIVWSNTLPNCRIMQNGAPVTTPFDGKAGLSGIIVKEISIRLISKAKAWIPPWASLDFIGCGGALTGDDVADYLATGAAAVQCVSGPVWHPNGQRFFTDLLGSEALQSALINGGWFAADHS